MIKDLLATLQDGIMDSAERRINGQEFLGSFSGGAAAPVGTGGGGGGGAGGKGGGISNAGKGADNSLPDAWQQSTDASLDATFAALRNKGIPDGKGSAGTKLGAFLKAISSQESGGNYKAVGVATKYGTAYGKYQILDSNFKNPGGWDKETLGRDVTVQQYLNNPKIQEKMARGKLTSYFNQYGAGGAAKAWYAGPGNANTNSDSSQYGGPSINDYAAQVLARMKNYL